MLDKSVVLLYSLVIMNEHSPLRHSSYAAPEQSRLQRVTASGRTATAATVTLLLLHGGAITAAERGSEPSDAASGLPSNCIERPIEANAVDEARDHGRVTLLALGAVAQLGEALHATGRLRSRADPAEINSAAMAVAYVLTGTSVSAPGVARSDDSYSVILCTDGSHVALGTI